ncbi:MAG: formylglycine-generating enzyme family protein [Alphaproteobacteria bacterium]|nr:formylglycine-generating enzyme family protein [Alphaproteobacteria bacterium]
MPPAHPIRRRVATYLSGEGALTLVTDPPGARVGLFRYAEHRRRLVPRFERDLGTTPLASVPVPMGSYLCVVEHPACETVKVPIEIVRNGHWDGVPPGAHTTLPVWLPPRGSLGPDEVYVPAGWSRLGGDREVASFPPIRAWCGPLLVERFPVTNRRYIAFLDDLVASGREEEALRHAPRLQAANTGETGALLYAFDGRRFSVKRDGQGDEWDPEYPVLYVDWFGARAWCRWSAERTGRTWRLPCELEWEHVARGVDGRAYPWGDQSDPSWMCITVSRETTPLPSVVRDFEVDESPYGVRGLAGNVMDWCLDPSRAPVPVVDGRIDPSSVTIDESPTTYRSIRGGSWFSAAQHCRSAYRNNVSSSYRESVIGFRAFASV